MLCGAGMWNGFQAMEDAIKKSELNYTIVHCPILDASRPDTITVSGFKIAVDTDQMFMPPFILPPGCSYIFAKRSYPDVARFFIENLHNFQRKAVSFR